MGESCRMVGADKRFEGSAQLSLVNNIPTALLNVEILPFRSFKRCALCLCGI